MNPKVKVVIGANYGDEGKGLVSYCLTKEAADHGHKVLSVLFNGGAQRGHTAGGKVHHCTGSGVDLGADTYYGPRFMVDPIALWLSETRVFIDPMCRVVFPHDVIKGRVAEKTRGDRRHGSCGMGIYAACKRNGDPQTRTLAKDVLNRECTTLRDIKNTFDRFDILYGEPVDLVYNRANFYEAWRWVAENCQLATLEELKKLNRYGTVIFEGGQGLLLDQSNKGGFPHLTPSSTGGRNTLGMVKTLGGNPDIYYVSRTYMTRHGAGKMLNECEKADINEEIRDETNTKNEWQGSLRFGYLSPSQLQARIRRDLGTFEGFDYKRVNMVFTQLNYTHGKLAVSKDSWMDISKPSFANRLIVSDKVDEMRVV